MREPSPSLAPSGHPFPLSSTTNSNLPLFTRRKNDIDASATFIGKSVFKGVCDEFIHDQSHGDCSVRPKEDLLSTHVHRDRPHVSERIAQVLAAHGQIIAHVDQRFSFFRKKMTVRVCNDMHLRYCRGKCILRSLFLL